MTARSTIFLNFVRHYAAPKHWKRDGVKYGCVTYYPKNKDHVDPQFVPTKLLVVQRVKPFMGNPYWEKDILRKHLGFDRKQGDVAIVKNTPEMCALLWKVKHLVKISPLKLPDKLPTEDDLNGTYLHENGTLYVIPKVNPVRCEATEQFVNNPKRLNRDVIKEKLRLQWLQGNLM